MALNWKRIVAGILTGGMSEIGNLLTGSDSIEEQWDKFKNGTTNETNKEVAEDTNETNKKINEETNQANKEIAESTNKKEKGGIDFMFEAENEENNYMMDGSAKIKLQIKEIKSKFDEEKDTLDKEKENLINKLTNLTKKKKKIEKFREQRNRNIPYTYSLFSSQKL